MSAASDPYFLVREEIQDSVNKLHAGHERWERLAQGSDSRGSVAQDLVGECDSVLWQLEELERATALAEKDYARFRIEKAELASRRSWNSATRTQVEALKSTLAAAARDRKASTKPAQNARSAAAKLDNAISSQNDSYLDSQADQQALLLRRQDDDLDDLGQAVARLGNVGLTIGEELDAQGKLLEDLEEDVDGTTSRLAAAQRKLTQVIKKSGMGGQIAIIVCLMVLLIILMVVAAN